MMHYTLKDGLRVYEFEGKTIAFSLTNIRSLTIYKSETGKYILYDKLDRKPSSLKYDTGTVTVFQTSLEIVRYLLKKGNSIWADTIFGWQREKEVISLLESAMREDSNINMLADDFLRTEIQILKAKAEPRKPPTVRL